MLKLSVFTVMIPDLTPEEGAKVIKANGYDGVEWRVTHVPESRKSEAPSFWGNNLCTIPPTPGGAQLAKTIAQAEGLAIPGLGTYINVGDLELTEQCMQFARECGARQIRVNPGRRPRDEEITYRQSFERGRAFLTEAEALAKHYGVRVVVEIHHVTNIPSAALAYRMVEGFDPDYIGVIHDCGNMAHEGYEDYLMGLQLLGPYVAHVHVKNVKWTRPDGGGIWRASWAPLEDGVVDFETLFAALKTVNYDGWVGLEDFSAAYETPEALAHDAAFLNDIIERTYS